MPRLFAEQGRSDFLKDKMDITPRVRNLVVSIVALLYLAIVAHGFITVKPLLHQPFAGFLLMKNNFVPVIYLPEWEGYKRGIKFGDIVKAVDGKPVTDADEVRKMVAGTRPGTSLTYTILRGDQTFELTVPVTVFDLRDMIFPSLSWQLMGLIYVLSGLIVFYLRPNLPVSRAFLFHGMVAGYAVAASPAYCIINSNNLPLILMPLLGPSVLILSLYFPVELKRRKLVIALLAITTLPIIFFNLYYFLHISRFLVVDKIFLAHTVLTFGLGALLMFISFVASTDAAVRQKGKIVVFGFVVGAIGCGIGVLGALVFKVFNFFWMFIPMALAPLSLTYAIVKHNLFDVDVFIRRSASYLLASGIVLVLFFTLIAGFSFILQGITGQSSQIAAVLSTLVMVILFLPLQRRMDRSLDRRFFRERYEYQATIQRASAVLVSIIELDRLLNQILNTILDAIQIERGWIMLRQPEPKLLQLAAARGYADPARWQSLPLDHPLARHLQEKGRALQLHDIEGQEPSREQRDEILEWMRELQVMLVIPILYERRLIGVLGLGEKKTGAGYTGEDVGLLFTLMMQTAVSIENARKVEELKKMVELETSYRELKKLDEMKDDFLSMVSHDLRTPMTSIEGYAELLLERLGRPEPAEQKLCLEVIAKESQRLTRLIDSLLDLQRFEAGMMELDFQEVDLGKLVQESVASFLGAAYAKQIHLENDSAPGTVRVRADRDRLAQVMANLLSNAIKFTPPAGRVQVRLETVAENGQAAARVSISDSGPGIRRELQLKIFDKFQQGDKLARVRERGSGLGLALARQIIEHHGGRVGLVSEPGRGSSFYFLLPTQA
jgi:signal transduction histidine kinase